MTAEVIDQTHVSLGEFVWESFWEELLKAAVKINCYSKESWSGFNFHERDSSLEVSMGLVYLKFVSQAKLFTLAKN